MPIGFDPIGLYGIGLEPAAGGGGTTYDVTVTETATGADVHSAVMTALARANESAAAAETFLAILTASVRVNETSTAADAVSSIGTFLPQVNEGAAGTDTFSAVIAGSVYNVTVLESATGTDTVSASRVFLATVAEAASGTDTVSSRTTFSCTLLEQASGADAPRVATMVAFVRIVEATIAIDASGGAGGTATDSVSEGARASDMVSARLLWEPIDPVVAGGWNPIAPVVSGSWTPITPETDPDWQNTPG